MQFSRTVAPETAKGPALVALMGRYIFKKVAVLGSTDSAWFQTAFELTEQLKDAGIEVWKPAAFAVGNFGTGTLREIKSSGFRVILLIAGTSDTQTAARTAKLQGMSGKGWSWLILEKKRGVQVEGWLFLQQDLPSEGIELFKQQVSEYTKSIFNLTITPNSVDLTYSLALWNAIMLYAYAATKVLSEGGDLHDGQAVTEVVRSTKFEGVGGNTVFLDKKGDRIESYR